MGSPNFPSKYPGLAPCVIKVGANIGGIKAVAFKTEDRWDNLYINGNTYHGTNGPPDDIVPTTDIAWNPDHSVERSGWKLCQSDVTTPAPTVEQRPTPTPTLAQTCTRGEPRKIRYGVSRAVCDTKCA